MCLQAALFVLSICIQVSAAQPIAATPTMGWNSWYALGKAKGWVITNETVIRATAEKLVSTGLAAAGYEYLVIDDSWENTHRDPDGSLQANPLKFPSGMDSMAEFIRGRGLKLGLYTTPGNFTCSGETGGEPGSYGHTSQDVALWVEKWGIEYLKDCVCNTTKELRTHAYSDMKAALDKASRPVVYECDPFMDRPWETLYDVCNIWAVSDDIADDFQAWTTQIDTSYAQAINKHAGPGHWSSFDYLQVGNGGQTFPEYRAQFSLYAILAAPLFIGSDVRTIGSEALAVYLAHEVIAVSQDRLGKPGLRLWQNETSKSEVWARPLYQQPDSGPDCAVVLFNRAEVMQNISVSWTELAALGKEWQNMQLGGVRDLWAEKAVGLLSKQYMATVEPHSARMLRISLLR